MTNPKSFITEYLSALSGNAKTPALVQRYVSDERLARHIADIEAAFPNYELVPEDMLAEGDKVAVRGVFRGTHRGPFAGVQPTGKSVSAGLIIIYAVAAGRIADHWMQFDLFTLMQQLQAPAESPVS
jgi:predicted ester cyclase